ncbi:DUF2333 family protein [Hwanghaeella grinnelliae]|uniref:DUF2333 family protein n=1 Tax=Hwanghaeella grinnelliae TaxID=2500179 RepID=A0A3S2Z7B1_9PROT|nr:DUF2333 family protein [Hwanghaeella grinnelliae]RVU36313.1 DUF2333 family protein [Hwanghaeella grinnelliae]
MMDKIALGERLRALPRPEGRAARFTIGTAALIVLAALLYYPIGMIMVHRIDDDTSIIAEAPQGGSEAVAMTIRIIDRETRENSWTPMAPFFMPSAALDNMPNFQTGIRDALSRFTIELTDQIGRVRGSSAADTDLEAATGFLKYAPDVWYYNISESLLPQRSSAEQYRNAADALRNYNLRLSEGNAVFERRADNLLGTLERFSSDLGSASAATGDALEEYSAFSIYADDVFYHNKGRLYGYYMLLNALQADFQNVISEKEVASLWAQMLASLHAAAIMDPLVVINGSPDGLLLPSHLSAQGFYLLRARTQLKEIINVLLK